MKIISATLPEGKHICPCKKEDKHTWGGECITTVDDKYKYCYECYGHNNPCKHDKTTRVSNDEGEVRIMCDNCPKQWSENDWTSMREVNYG